MCLPNNCCHTLAIIGNGFDLAHGFSTTYKEFASKTSAPSLEFFKSCCEDESSITSWYLFEENIQILTLRLFQQSSEENLDPDNYRNKVSDLRNAFKDIHGLLIQYLRSETETKSFTLLPSVKKYLKPTTTAINFNYTKVAEAYTKEVIYVHGSLAENDILLGYDYRDEPCLARYDDMCWSKRICREALAFRRYLKEDLGLATDSPEYERLLSSLESYQERENSGSGIDTDSGTYLPDFKFVDNFMKRYKDDHDVPEIDYEGITTIIVLGHGIEADQAYLKRILDKCSNLESVIIYRYHSESDLEIARKADFFRSYCKEIHSILY